MNKQELIEHYEKILDYGFLSVAEEKIYTGFVEKLKQLDEPQKVTVPQFVADYIKYAKEVGWDLLEAMKNVPYEDNAELRKWFYKGGNVDVFARAWLDGYEVEEEKRYYVRFKGMESNDFNYLNFIKFQHAWVLSSIKLDKKFRTEHTKKQLEEAGFGWVFDCEGIEIEEVEDE